jgi:hypothetical protein
LDVNKSFVFGLMLGYFPSRKDTIIKINLNAAVMLHPLYLASTDELLIATQILQFFEL